MRSKTFFALLAGLGCLVPTLRSVTLTDPGLTQVTVAAGITNASCMALLPDGRVLVGQQNGIVRLVKDGAFTPAPFVVLGVNSSQERGLVGIAADPGFQTNGYVYVHYTTNAGASVIQRVSRFTANGDVAAPGSEFVVVDTEPFTATREVGGGLAFGNDGFLYIGMGQCGAGAATLQSSNNLFGKILRLSPDGTIPPSNPFFGQNTGKNRAVWAYGFRNPYSLSVQPSTGRIMVNDVGAQSREEINELVAGGNYGWPTCEGPCANTNFVQPRFAYPSGVITGGTFYEPAFPQFGLYVGSYFFVDWELGSIRAMNATNGNVTAFATNITRLVALATGPDGSLYFLAQGNSPGNGHGVLGRIIAGSTTIVPSGSSWRYLDTGETNISPAWTQVGFDDSSWSNGVAQLGYGNGDRTMIRALRTNGTRIVTHYFRHSFVVSNTAPYSNLVVNFIRDDGGILYLNGTEVFRSNMPTGGVTSTTLALTSTGGTDEALLFGTLVDPALLVTGTNVLAAEIHLSSTTDTDLSFNATLLGLPAHAVLYLDYSAGSIALSYPRWAGRFLLESASAITGPWSPVSATPVAVGNRWRVTLGTGEEQQFFRLRSP